MIQERNYYHGRKPEEQWKAMERSHAAKDCLIQTLRILFLVLILAAVIFACILLDPTALQAADTERLALPLFEQNQAQPHIKYNEAIRILDAFVPKIVFDVDLATQPTNVSEGAVYILPANATGTDWFGNDNKVAHYYNASWHIYDPTDGYFFYEYDSGIVYQKTTTGYAPAYQFTLSNTFQHVDVVGFQDVTSTSTFVNIVPTSNGGVFLYDINDGGSSANTKLNVNGLTGDSYIGGPLMVGASGSVESSAVLAVAFDVEYPRGFSPPSTGDTGRDNIPAPTPGLMVFNSATDLLNYYNDEGWVAVANTRNITSEADASFLADVMIGGTTDPADDLEISGGASPAIRWTDDQGNVMRLGYALGTSAGVFTLRDHANSASVLRIVQSAANDALMYIAGGELRIGGNTDAGAYEFQVVSGADEIGNNWNTHASKAYDNERGKWQKRAIRDADGLPIDRTRLTVQDRPKPRRWKYEPGYWMPTLPELEARIDPKLTGDAKVQALSAAFAVENEKERRRVESGFYDREHFTLVWEETPAEFKTDNAFRARTLDNWRTAEINRLNAIVGELEGRIRMLETRLRGVEKSLGGP